MEENNTMDTPQANAAEPIRSGSTPIDAFATPSDEGSNDNSLSVEDAFFGKTEVNTEAAPQEGTPAVNQEVPAQQEEYDAKNDSKRYEYWQSQAAKKDNELQKFKGELDAVANQLNAHEQQVAQTQPSQNKQEFPPPPSKPEKPRTFSREEAWNDPSSESAKYLDEIDSWNDNMSEYRDIRSQYEIALVREQIGAQEQAKRQEDAARAQYRSQQKQIKDVFQHVTGHYGLQPDEAREFIKTMSNPNSISMDNLVNLYRMKKGAAPVNTQSQGPSDAFQQSRNAQQVPSPMGVMPGQATESTRSDSDTIMDDIITDFKSKNPWGN